MQRIFRLTQLVTRLGWCRSSLSQQQLQVQHQQQPAQQLCCRWLSDKKVQLTDGEKAIIDKLRSTFPGAKSVEVTDISGGCGAMYQISIEAEEFRGKRTVNQHRLVNEVSVVGDSANTLILLDLEDVQKGKIALAEEIKSMHGLQLNTKVPADSP